MITYRNITAGDLYLEDENGIHYLVKSGEQLSGNSYFRRFATGTAPVLEIISDDGSYWIDGAGYSGAGRTPYSETFTIDAGSDFTDAGNVFDASAELGGPAVATWIKNSASGAGIKVRINDTAIISIDIGETVTFDLSELLIVKLEFKNENESPASVEVLVVGQ